MKSIFFVLVITLTGMFGNAHTVYICKVTDENNVPLIGVNVISTVDGAIGTTTNSEGNFEIALDAPQVVVSHVGF